MKHVKDFNGYFFESSGIGPNDPIILSNEKTIVFRNVEQDTEPFFKPKGLWYGLGTSWIFGLKQICQLGESDTLIKWN